MQLNEALRLMRAYHNMKQNELALRLEVSQSYLSEIESSKKQPTVDLLQKYSEIFAIPVSSIMFFTEQKEDKSKTENFVTKKAIQILSWMEEITSDK
jgi:transcriptional regulator with XRE-family HTH domain